MRAIAEQLEYPVEWAMLVLSFDTKVEGQVLRALNTFRNFTPQLSILLH